MSQTDISVIILTFNEGLHIERCLRSLSAFTDKLLVIDSFSTDKTVEIAQSLGATVLQHPWKSYAFQFNYGIDHLPFDTQWVMRMDADEYVTPELAAEITRTLPTLPSEVEGLYMKRRVLFMNQWIRRGGYYPIWLLRIWRNSRGRCEELWMDEHIKLVNNVTVRLQHDIVDHNLNNLTWWTQKHNNYAIREVIDLLNIRYNFDEKETVEPRLFGSQEQRKRFLKIRYAYLPLFTRPLLYFLYRYFIKLGFLDGTKGLVWHFLQGFWYRFLVDAKLYEVFQRAGYRKEAIIQHLLTEYGKDVRPNTTNEHRE